MPINYASRYRSSGDLARASYLPFKVNATGVMPVIFASSLLAVPGAVARFSGVEALQPAATALAPGGPLYLPANVLFIIGINYYYTFLQLDPNDVSDQLKRQVRAAALCAPAPGRRPRSHRHCRHRVLGYWMSDLKMRQGDQRCLLPQRCGTSG